MLIGLARTMRSLRVNPRPPSAYAVARTLGLAVAQVSRRIQSIKRTLPRSSIAGLFRTMDCPRPRRGLASRQNAPPPP